MINFIDIKERQKHVKKIRVVFDKLISPNTSIELRTGRELYDEFSQGITFPSHYYLVFSALNNENHLKAGKIYYPIEFCHKKKDYYVLFNKKRVHLGYNNV